jgi:hypothetical protein
VTDIAPDDTQSAEPPQVRPFAAFLQEQSRGRTHLELSEQLHALIAAVAETGKAGSLVLRIDVKPISPGDTSTLTVTDAITVKAPKADRPKSIFFVDGTGNLSREDPKQPVLEGLRVATPTIPTQLRSAR